MDFDKWKTKIADGNTWLKLKLNFSPDHYYFGDEKTDEIFKSIYEDKCFRIISSGIDQKGLYVGIDPQNGFLCETLKPMIILLGATGKIGQHTGNSTDALRHLQYRHNIYNKFFD